MFWAAHRLNLLRGEAYSAPLSTQLAPNWIFGAALQRVREKTERGEKKEEYREDKGNGGVRGNRERSVSWLVGRWTSEHDWLTARAPPRLLAECGKMGRKGVGRCPMVLLTRGHWCHWRHCIYSILTDCTNETRVMEEYTTKLLRAMLVSGENEHDRVT